MSLLSLAKENKLPDHQYMDKETIDWIISNKPDSISQETLFEISDNEISFIKNYIPSHSWFLETRQINSIHGIRHLLRVAIYILKLCRKLKVNSIIAAVLHDIRRLNDKNDPKHGERSARWFLDNISKVTKKFEINLSKNDIKEIYDMIFYHDIPYNNVKKDSNAYNDISILKTADALDRYCQPKLKWWINDDYLTIKPSEKLKFFSYNLVVKSEKLVIKGFNC